MKRTFIISIAMLLLTAAMLGQSAEDLRSVRADMMGALTGDMERFERGMRTIDALLERNPKDPAILVMHGNGMMVRAGEGFKKGDMANAAKLWQSGLGEMSQAVELAPDSLLVRARRGVIMITASRLMPPQMGTPLLQLGVGDFEKVPEIQRSHHSQSGCNDWDSHSGCYGRIPGELLLDVRLGQLCADYRHRCLVHHRFYDV
jgi:hypothetical protein